MSGKELPTFKFALEKSKAKVVDKSTAREATALQLPISKGIAGVSMQLEPGAMRELHWHATAAEWAFVDRGRVRTTVFGPGGVAETNDFEPVVGHTFQFRDAPGWDGIVDCEVLEVAKPRRLSYSWGSSGVGDARLATVVTWTLAEGEGGVTRLHLEQSGFRPESKQEIAGARYGWTNMLDQLRNLLAAS